MSQVFISYSRKDHVEAATVVNLLQAQHFGSVFLDADPESGITLSSNWLDVLFVKLRQCRAVVVVHSVNWASSRWCFAEVAQAISLGRAVLTICIDDAPLAYPLSSLQTVSFFDEHLLPRLLKGLRAAGVRPSLRGLDRLEKSPFPGLGAFQSDDASMFFGRDTDAQNVLDRMTLLRRFDGPRLVLLAGSSGCGKSSLMHAGVLPLLEANECGWKFAGLIRPLEELPSTEPVPNKSSGLVSVLAIDQLEEVLNLLGREEQRAWMLELAKWLVAQPQPRQAMATIRTDALARFGQIAADASIPFEIFAVPALGSAQMAEAITGPSDSAGIELELGLAQRMVEDCGDSRSLPLMAYTLREMYIRTSEPRRFTHELYAVQLGGIKGSIERTTEAAVSGLMPNSEDALRRLFLKLVKVDEAGSFVRRRLRVAELSPEEQALMARLVPTVLTSDVRASEPTIEVAHEALFEQWPKLRAWLDEYRPLLESQRRFKMALQEWERSGAKLTEATLEEFEGLVAAGDVPQTESAKDLLALSRSSLRQERWGLGLQTAIKWAGYVFAVVLLGAVAIEFSSAPFGFNTAGEGLRSSLYGLTVFAILGGLLTRLAKPRTKGSWAAGAAAGGSLFASCIFAMQATSSYAQLTVLAVLLAVIPPAAWLFQVGLSLLLVREGRARSSELFAVAVAVAGFAAALASYLSSRATGERELDAARLAKEALQYGLTHFRPSNSAESLAIVSAVSVFALTLVVLTLIPAGTHRSHEVRRLSWLRVIKVWNPLFAGLLAVSALLLGGSFVSDWRDREASSYSAAECAAATTSAWLDGHMELTDRYPQSLEGLAQSMEAWTVELVTACKSTAPSSSHSRLRQLSSALGTYTACDAFNGWAAVTLQLKNDRFFASVQTENENALCQWQAPADAQGIGASRAVGTGVAFTCGARPWYSERSSRKAPVRFDQAKDLDDTEVCANIDSFRHNSDLQQRHLRTLLANVRSLERFER